MPWLPLLRVAVVWAFLTAAVRFGACRLLCRSQRPPSPWRRPRDPRRPAPRRDHPPRPHAAPPDHLGCPARNQFSRPLTPRRRETRSAPPAKAVPRPRSPVPGASPRAATRGTKSQSSGPSLSAPPQTSPRWRPRRPSTRSAALLPPRSAQFDSARRSVLAWRTSARRSAVLPQVGDASERIPGSTRRSERRKGPVPLTVIRPCATARRARPILARAAGCRVDHRLVGARAPVLVDPEPHRPPMRDAPGIPSPDLLGPSPDRPLRARARKGGGKATRRRQARRHRTHWHARAPRGRPPP